MNRSRFSTSKRAKTIFDPRMDSIPAAKANKYSAKPSDCQHGHFHDSRREAARCNELHLLQRAREISGLVIQPVYEFIINERPVMMENGHRARFTPDFQYNENGKIVVEDVKGMIVRDFPLRAAIFRHLYPDRELRVTS